VTSKRQAAVKKAVLGFVAVGAIFALRPVTARMRERVRGHFRQMALHCKQTAAQCRQMSAQVGGGGEASR
jgi:hypothetical protein